MLVRSLLLFCALLFTACSVKPNETIRKIVLIAPFEGRYREIGYNALYATQLAIQDFGNPTIELLAIEDGGSVSSAISRANAITQDSSIQAVLTLGPYATHTDVLQVIEKIPVVVISSWLAQPINENVVILSNPDIPDEYSVPPDIDIYQAVESPAPLIGNEMFALEQFPTLRDDLEGITIVSSGDLPDDDFREKYRNSGQFTPEPNLWATLTYDATMMTLISIANDMDLNQLTHTGINGEISFEDGYWADAPIHQFTYDDSDALQKQD